MAAAAQAGLFAPAVVPRLERWDPATWNVAADWREVVDEFLRSEAARELGRFIQSRLADGAVIFPPRPLRALELTALAQVRAVILGQDPYHGAGQAEGLAFSVAPGIAIPPSLRNIHHELGCGPRASGSLEAWARQGVLLLNSCLTVEQGQAGSHAGRGWEALTSAVIAQVAQVASPCVYLLWGVPAQRSAALIREQARLHGREVLVLEANHPSPLAARRPPRPFVGCGHFGQARQWLAQRGFPGVFEFPHPARKDVS